MCICQWDREIIICKGKEKDKERGKREGEEEKLEKFFFIGMVEYKGWEDLL